MTVVLQKSRMNYLLNKENIAPPEGWITFFQRQDFAIKLVEEHMRVHSNGVLPVGFDILMRECHSPEYDERSH